MSLIGPRPLLENDLIILKQNNPDLYRRRIILNSNPGITGCWQIWGDRKEGTKILFILMSFMKKKKSPLFDLKIMINTARVV